MTTTKPVVILGPTASGKSDTAMAVARTTNTEIVVCDAMQVYRGMDIGTAKPTLADRTEVPHHCVDLVEATERFTVSDYQLAARAVVADIMSRGANALVVAGTGLYLTALIDELEFPGEYPEVRRELDGERRVETLYRRLEELDP
ncbi:MAG: tRNA (adenosine(37)-N6)-dimethylallyltransferase MiaA, partial [Actinobacteria bacterium]|nr:tRNA (adenosine(37)-N6)-dimethylallyltransferase MiaA [Actinomycetota bacterium]